MPDSTGTIFGDVFNIQSQKVLNILKTNHFLESMAHDFEAREQVQALHDNMRDQHHISVDGDLMFNAGSIGLISRPASTITKQIIPDAIARIDNVETLINPAVLHPVIHHRFDGPVGPYHLYVLPNAPDLLNPDTNKRVTNADVKRTIRVLKANDKEHCFWDFRKDNDNFVFLKGVDGEILRYPVIPNDPDFHGHKDRNGKIAGEPIAFIRDFNSTSIEGNRQYGLDRLEKIFLNYPPDQLPAAPRECVEACKEQYKLSAKLIDHLQEAGIEPNIMPPVGKWAHDIKSGRTSIPIMNIC